MHHLPADRYSGLDSPLHRFNPRLKIGCAVLFVLMTVFIRPDDYPLFAGHVLLLALLLLMSRIPVHYFADRLLPALPFIVILSLCAFFTLPENPSGQGPWALPAALALKACLSLAALTLLTSSTPFDALLKGFRGLGVPAVLVLSLSFFYRYFYVLRGTWQKLHHGWVSRGGGFRNRGALPPVAGMAGVLFLKSLERSEAVHAAMLSRGFTISPPPQKLPAPSFADWGGFAVFVAVVAAARLTLGS